MFWRLKRCFQHPVYADVDGHLALLDDFRAFGEAGAQRQHAGGARQGTFQNADFTAARRTGALERRKAFAVVILKPRAGDQRVVRIPRIDERADRRAEGAWEVGRFSLGL